MYGYNNPTFSRADQLRGDAPAAPPISLPLAYELVIPENQLASFEVGQSSSNSSYDSPSSLAGYGAQRASFMQRSISSHSLLKNGYSNCHFASPREVLDMDTSPVRRVFSTGDLQHGQHQRAESPLSSESNMIIESMSKACKYSPEEKKERIERYRSKRNLRNFNKKIQYACRKTLADSRPRIRGRFARNDELERNPQLQWRNMMSGEEEEDDDENWINFLDAFSSNSIP